MQYLHLARGRRQLGIVLLTGLLLGLVLPAANVQAKEPEWAIVYLKDGFAIQGFVKRETADVEVDSYSGTAITIPKGFYLMDDGPRRISFAPTQVGRVDVRKFVSDEKVMHVKHFPKVGMTTDVPAILDVLKATEFDKDWERTLSFRGKTKDPRNPLVTQTVAQHIGMLTPYSLRVDTTTTYLYSSAYLTREFSPEVIQFLLANHENYAVDRSMPDNQKLQRRLAYCEFMVQAGYFEYAEQELARMLKDLPKDKDTIQKQIRKVGEVKARESFEEIKRLAVAGQHQTVLKRIETFPQECADAGMQAKMRELKADYEKAVENRKLAQQYLKDLAEGASGARGAVFREAAEAISKEVSLDNANRLDTFLGQVKQYERLKSEGKKTEVGPTELLSLAMSSWLLGSASGETKPETALRLWKTRQLVLDYEKTNDLNLRMKMRQAALQERNDLAMVEEVSQVIPNLPPVEAAEISMKTQPMQAGRNTVYQLQLPPEYNHGRHYPVLIVLHQAGETARDQLDRWRDAAADNGYILAAPEWGGGKGYTYSEKEHQTVLDTLRDLRRKYRVDSDRVFLFGLREGGSMAFDVGLSHPDLFAGVSTMGAVPEMFSEVYWHNQQYLPFYVVNGDRIGKLWDTTHRHFANVLGKHFPALWVQYKGRGLEWFPGEVPTIFEWMRVKRRAFPLTQLGQGSLSGSSGTEFNTMRPTDNSFYWLTTDAVSNLCCNSATNFRPALKPAALQATIDPLKNDIRVSAVGVKQVSVWLGRNLGGESMIDFTKPASFRLNNKIWLDKKMVNPSLEVLLEDLYRRGDRQRIYMAKLDATQ
jgi:pimeloyl-ACP methyl ester carboxylesterase